MWLHCVVTKPPYRTAHQDGTTAVMAAAEGGHVSLVEYLIKCGADFNHADVVSGFDLHRIET